MDRAASKVRNAAEGDEGLVDRKPSFDEVAKAMTAREIIGHERSGSRDHVVYQMDGP